MKYISFLLFVLFMSITITSCKKDLVSKVALPDGYYENQWDDALTAAKDHDRNVFVHFYAEWCSLCASFKEEVLNDAEVEVYMKDKFIGVLMDSEKDKGLALVQQHNLTGHPHFAVFDKNGILIGSHKGKLNKAEFQSWIVQYE